ncbi:uncharacterized protein [Primulina eburnea]|uniref:uncharacterized protein isoform X2 n=1 Tax=Primulina eburnea TaxID=1245227 RepID=UPI003C6CC0DA
MMSSDGIQMSDQPIFQNNEPSQPRNSVSSFDVKFLDTKHLNVEDDVGLTLNDVSEGGSVAVCAAEKVLASPSSQEAGYECAKPLRDTKFDVQTMIKTTHNLSELLLCHLSHDACSALEEKNMEVIKSIISNLNACMRTNIDQGTNEPKLKKCVRDTSAIIEESHSVDKISDGPSTTNETFNSHFQPDFIHMGEGKTNESLVFSPLRGEGIKRNDDTTKAIKKILEENFHCYEGISSQALLFKSLWLEAEANLCSIGYKARFDQMKIEMESEDVAVMMSKIRSMPDPNTDSKLTPNTHGGTSPSSALKNSFNSSTTENVDDVEASIMARSKILKSLGDNIESINLEKEQQSEMGDCEHAGSIMERFNILKSRKSRENDLSYTNIGKGQQLKMANCDDLEPVLVSSNAMKPREDSLTSTNKEEEPHTENVNDEHAESVMARFNILQSRAASSRIYVQEEQQVDFEFFGKKNVAAVKNAQSEAEVFYLSPKPQQTGSLSEHEFGSKLDDCGYGSPKELHFSVPDDPMMRSFNNGKMMNQWYSRLPDSSLSSDWEHVKKDDFAWKNF